MIGSRTAEGGSAAVPPPVLVEHFFRHEYGRLVAVLTRTVGVRHLDVIEDAVQSAMLTALTSWIAERLPDDPGAWLYRVAYNNVIDDLRRKSGRDRILAQAVDQLARDSADVPGSRLAQEVADDTLRMLFVCCDEAIPRESQLVFALKTLCGFSVSEIALRLFTSDANVYKRYGRARDRLREMAPELETPPWEALRSRVPAVQAVLYLLFNEGHLSSRGEEAIRRELCEEAVRLTTLLAEHPIGAVPDTFALLALMHLHAARLGARRDATGGLLLLDEQDRSLWDPERLRIGAEWLQRSATGDVFSKFHAEAAIAAEHCFAPSFEATRWKDVADLYAMLERIDPSPLHTLNRAVAVAEWQGPAAGLAVLQALTPPAWLSGSYLWNAVVADLNRRTGEVEIAERHYKRALLLAPTAAVRALLRRRLTTAAWPTAPPGTDAS